MKKDVIIACDFQDKTHTLDFLKKFGELKPYLKIGMELFYREGADFVHELKDAGYKIFLDLKLHDIPTTVNRAMKNIARLSVDMTNVHAAGGKAMMTAAKEGLADAQTLLIAVTQLTSTSAEMLRDELLIETDMQTAVRIYAQNAKEAGLAGVVCSAHEAAAMKSIKLITVTPGIRLLGDGANDQARVATPEFAKKSGCDYIVVGRSITGASDPTSAYRRCVNEFLGE
jgi:orotidine-5'-phosphate decarboxylase